MSFAFINIIGSKMNFIISRHIKTNSKCNPHIRNNLIYIDMKDAFDAKLKVIDCVITLMARI